MAKNDVLQVKNVCRHEFKNLNFGVIIFITIISFFTQMLRHNVFHRPTAIVDLLRRHITASSNRLSWSQHCRKFHVFIQASQMRDWRQTDQRTLYSIIH